MKIISSLTLLLIATYSLNSTASSLSVTCVNEAKSPLIFNMNLNSTAASLSFGLAKHTSEVTDQAALDLNKKSIALKKDPHGLSADYLYLNGKILVSPATQEYRLIQVAVKESDLSKKSFKLSLGVGNTTSKLMASTLRMQYEMICNMN